MPENQSKLHILRILEELGGGIEGRTRLMKLLFLLQNETHDISENEYGFYPYNYGPFSEEVLDLLDELEEEDLLEKKESSTPTGNVKYNYKLTEEGEGFLQEESPEYSGEFFKILDEYGKKPILLLIEEVYEDYPDMAEESMLK